MNMGLPSKQLKLSEVVRMGLDATGLVTQRRAHLHCLMRKSYLQPRRAHTRNHDLGLALPRILRKWVSVVEVTLLSVMAT